MSMIKFNGVHKAPGRPTLVEGIEGRRYVDNKILKNLERTQRGGGYNAYTSGGGQSPFSYSPGQSHDELEYGVDEYGLSNEPLTPEQEYQNKDGYSEQALEEPNHIEPYYEEFQYDESQCMVAAYDAGEMTSCQDLIWVQDAAGEAASAEQSEVAENLSQFENCHWQFTLPSVEPAQNVYDKMHYEQERVCRRNQFGSEPFQYGVEIRSFDGPHLHRKEVITEEGFEIGDVLKTFCADNSFTESREICPSTNTPTSHLKTMKTGILRLPSSGVARSSRGTVELLVHANGLTFKPFYNLCGMLMCVTMSDGRRIEKGFKGFWRLVDAEGKASSDKIETVSFDKKGNLWYQTSRGKRVTFFVDGHSETLRQIS